MMLFFIGYQWMLDTMNHWETRITNFLHQQKESHNYRVRKITQKYDQHLNFASNDYLGLSKSPELIQAWQKGADKYGVGSAGSSHVSGYHEPLAQLEKELAAWLGYERAIVYSTGFAANQALIQLLIEKEDWIIADKLIHASLAEAGINSIGTFKRFRHNDLDSLNDQLSSKTENEAGALIVTEGIFSMDGDEAPLTAIADLLKHNQNPNEWLVIDDAHGIGVHGNEGRGTCDKYSVHPDILIVTFGKGLGVSGAAILCSEQVAEYLVQRSRALIYSTAIPPAQAYALLTSIELVKKSDDRRQYLDELIQYCKSELKTLDITNESNSAIQPIIIGSNEKSLEVSQVLTENNIWALAIRPPTVPPNSARIRLTLNANHTKENIDELIKVLRHAMDR